MKIEVDCPTVGAFRGTIVQVSDQGARVQYPFDAAWCNPKGTLQGGVIAVFLDDCMGLAMVGRFGGHVLFSTTSMTLSYLRPIVQGEVTAVGRVVHAGQRSACLEADLLDNKGRLAARGISTVLRLDG